ncbi:MAG: hypothetical protein Q8R29_01555 [bacterium]|nr:hypothetical protein [bacterium]
MSKHTWRVLKGLIQVVLIYLPIQIVIFTVSQFDNFWNEHLWQKLWQRDFHVLGFLFSIGIFYLIGFLTETKLLSLKRLNWLHKKVPILGSLFIFLNPHASEILRKSKGAMIANFNSGWQVAFLTAVHETMEGYFGSVLYGTVPPTRQLLNERSRIYVLKVGKNERGFPIYEMIPTQTAIQQELSSGITVPPDAYKNAIEISFGEFVKSGAILEKEINHSE